MEIKNVCSLENYRDFAFAQHKTLNVRPSYTRTSIIYIKKRHHTLNSGTAFCTDGMFQMSPEKQVLIGICTLT